MNQSMEIPQAMKEQYLVRREKDLLDCYQALQNQNLEVLARVGHQMKGNALTFGHEPLAQIGANMETSAKNQNWEELAQYTDEFKAYLKSLSRLK